MGRRRHKQVHPVSDHDGPQWFSTVRFRDGWHVIRTCPCHDEVPVTRVFGTKERAERALEQLRGKQHGRVSADRHSDTPEFPVGSGAWQQPQADRGHKP